MEPIEQEPRRLAADDDDEPVAPPKPWTERGQDIGALLWASFLTAAAATMLFFAFVDPAEMQAAMLSRREVLRITGYSIGFFFFWLITAASAALTVYLVRTRKNTNGPDDRRR